MRLKDKRAKVKMDWNDMGRERNGELANQAREERRRRREEEERLA